MGLGACWIRDYHLNRDDDGNHRPYANCRYKRVKQRNGQRPYERKDEFQWLTITCTCNGQHAPLIICWTIKGLPKGGVIQGNIDCWYNQFRFATDHTKGEPTRRLLQHWNLRQRKFGRTNYAKTAVSQALQKFGEYSHRVMAMTIDTPCHDTTALWAAGPDLQPVGEEDFRAHEPGQSVAGPPP